MRERLSPDFKSETRPGREAEPIVETRKLRRTGNKRAAATAFAVTLLLNGWRLDVRQGALVDHHGACRWLA